jgi:hypothetical protein
MARKQKSEDKIQEKQPEMNFMADGNAPEVEIVVEAAPEGEQSLVLGAEEGIDVLRDRLEKAKERLAAEKQARLEAEQHVNRANMEVKENQMHLVANAIDVLGREREIIKNNIKELMSIGDYDRVVDLQEMLAINNSKLMELETGFKEMRNQPAPQPPKPPEASDIVDNLIRQVTPRSANWLEKNRDYLTDTKALRVMERAHGDALDNDIEPDSNEYFKFIEKRLGIAKPQRVERYQEFDDDEPVMSAASSATQRRSAPPAAPVSRSAQAGTNQRTVRLTPDQIEAAKISGLSPQKYYELMVKERERTSVN